MRKERFILATLASGLFLLFVFFAQTSFVSAQEVQYCEGKYLGPCGNPICESYGDECGLQPTPYSRGFCDNPDGSFNLCGDTAEQCTDYNTCASFFSLKFYNFSDSSLEITSISEQTGKNAAIGKITRTGDLRESLTVEVSSEDTRELTLSPLSNDIKSETISINFNAGESEASFEINSEQDNEADGDQQATITITPPTTSGYLVAEGVLVVLDYVACYDISDNVCTIRADTPVDKGCSCASEALADDNCKTVKLSKNIEVNDKNSLTGSSCVNYVDQSNPPSSGLGKVLDCQGKSIKSNLEASAVDPPTAILLARSSGLTIKNCVIEMFGDGVYLLSQVFGVNILSNTFLDNSGADIAISGFGNREIQVKGNVISGLEQPKEVLLNHGILLGDTRSSVVISDNRIFLQKDGLYFRNDNEAVIKHNTICHNTMDIHGPYEKDKKYVQGVSNACYNAKNWRDAGSEIDGCTYSCYGVPAPTVRNPTSAHQKDVEDKIQKGAVKNIKEDIEKSKNNEIPKIVPATEAKFWVKEAPQTP